MNKTASVIAGVITFLFLGLITIKLVAPVEDLVINAEDPPEKDIRFISGLFNGTLGIILGYYFVNGNGPVSSDNAAESPNVD